MNSDSWLAFIRAVPTALSLVPICLLFGLLAANASWSVVEVLLFSALGFSGSGQFALLPLAEKGQGILTMLIVATSMNSRYVPMAFAAASRLPVQPARRAFMAHILGDEAYTLEHERDSCAAVFTTRMTLYVTWIVATGAGVLGAGWIPRAWFDAGVHLGFPASMVLLVLCFGQFKLRIPQMPAPWRRLVREITLCVAGALVLLATMGPTWFWLPSVAFSAWRLGRLTHE